MRPAARARLVKVNKDKYPIGESHEPTSEEVEQVQTWQ